MRRLFVVLLGAACAAPPAPSRPTPAAAAPDSVVRGEAFTLAVMTQGGGAGGVPAGPRARMEPRTIPPRELISDSMFTLSVMVGADGKARLETLKLHAGATDAQRAATSDWLAKATFTMPQRDGQPVEAAYQMLGRVPSQAMMNGTGAFAASAPRAGGVIGDVVGGTPSAVGRSVFRRPGELSPEELIAVSSRVARIVSDLDTLRVRPGMRLDLATMLRIGVFDSAGAYLGLLSRPSSSVRTELAVIDGRSITVNGEHVVQLRLWWPPALWRGRAGAMPEVILPVVSSHAVTDAQLHEQMVTSGSGSGSCYLGLPDVSCDSREVRYGPRGEITRLQLVVIQRRPPQSNSRFTGFDDPARIAAERVWRAHSRAVEDRGRQFSGTYDENDRPIGYESKPFATDSIWVDGQGIATAWRRDSALVVLADHRNGATTVRSFMIPSDMPEGVSHKSWESGDTTFTVRPRDPSAKWRTFLTGFPAIAEFLK